MTPPPKSALAWSVLAALLLATLFGALSFDRERWPSVVGDEATYLMAAQSLAWDGDLTYSRADYERFVESWRVEPEGLILQSGDGGRTLTYGKPFFYPLLLAPFVRLAPVSGVFLANALLLALAGLAAARTLGRHLGVSAPVWVAVWLFGSVSFAYVFWAHADLFLMALTALALSLAYGGVPPGGRVQEVYVDEASVPLWHLLARWVGAGALLAVVTVSRPFYGSLFLPLALAVPKRRRRVGLAGLAGGAVLAALLAVGTNLAVHDVWSSYGGERMGFYSYTGFPAVDFPVEAWSERLAARPGKGSWVTTNRLFFPVDPVLTAHNALYFLVGRHVGVLVYFLPLVLGLAAFRPRRGRWALLVAVALTVAGFFYVRAFNFYGGGGAIANRYFLPVYPALWFLTARAARIWWPLVVALAAAPFLWPLWSAPRAYPLLPEGGYRYVSEAAYALPYETTLDHLKPSGREDFHHAGLWVKPLRSSVRARRGGAVIEWDTERPGELLLGSSTPLETLEMVLPSPAPARIEAAGGEVAALMLTADGGTRLQLALAGPYRRHRMWWTFEDVYLYRLELTLPAGTTPPRRWQPLHLRPIQGP